jgi:hypothetical protein
MNAIIAKASNAYWYDIMAGPYDPVAELVCELIATCAIAATLAAGLVDPYTKAILYNKAMRGYCIISWRVADLAYKRGVSTAGHQLLAMTPRAANVHINSNAIDNITAGPYDQGVNDIGCGTRGASQSRYAGIDWRNRT